MAMMLPLVSSDLRWLAFRSLAARRQRTIVLHVVAYMAVWLLVGTIVMAGAALVAITPLVIGSSFLSGAALWHITGARRTALLRCRAGELPAVRGMRADLDVLAAGIRSARGCLVACGLPMLAMATVHSLTLMVAITLLVASERHGGANPERRLGRPIESLGFAVLGLIVAAAPSVVL